VAQLRMPVTWFGTVNASTVEVMDLGLQGRRAAVAAASGGLGLASAVSLAAEGARVVICGRDRGRIDEAAARVGHGCVGLVQDVGDAAGGIAFVAAASEALGGLDIVVANGGGPPAGTFASTDLAAYAPALDLNLLSVVGMAQTAVPAMQASGWGRFVAITSISVRQPLGQLILSNTARAGVTGFLKTVAREVAADGVTVNSVQPGLHATARVTSLYGADADQMTLGDPGDFGAIVTFLCSDQARFVTGLAMHVDGGTYGGLQ
jgi:3-oxoacyl-[acyl-carrier protein] reductase